MVRLITGCMGSGKTARLIDLAERIPAENRLILAHHKEGENLFLRKQTITSRNGKTLDCNTTRFANTDNNHLNLYFCNASVSHIFIDEGQWIYKQWIRNAKKLADSGIAITVALLNRDYTGKYYNMYNIWKDIAGEIVHLRGICAVTGGYADYSELLTDTESTRKEDYRAVCEEVFRKSKHCKI